MNQNRALTTVLAIAATAGLALAQPPSPPMQTTATIGGKSLTIKYSAPSVRGRKIFGGSDALQPDNTVWRAGANNATALHTDGAIKIGSLDVPAGDYTLYVQLDPKAWQLIVSKQTGQWGINRDDSTSLDPAKELGRTPMTDEQARVAGGTVQDDTDRLAAIKVRSRWNGKTRRQAWISRPSNAATRAPVDSDGSRSRGCRPPSGLRKTPPPV